MTEWAKANASDREIYDPEEIFQAGERNHHISNTAYPMAHELTWKDYRVLNSNHAVQVEKSFQSLESINLYTHIPFCETRCYFCEYTVVNKKESEQVNDYMDALNKEVVLYSKLIGKKKILGFDIGGGTPSFIPSKLIEEHLKVVRNNFHMDSSVEISIETTPKIASLESDKINDYYQMGIRRISMGIQVTQPDLLRELGRESNGISNIKKATETIRSSGFKKFNVDLMYGFANQSLQSWEATLQFAVSLNPDYITLYRMRYKLTRISDQASRVELNLVKRMAQIAKEFLHCYGYIANPGKNTYSRIENDTGTSQYLTRRVIQGKPYLGLGLGAQTFTDTTIAYNSGSIGKNLAPYLDKISKNILPIQDLYDLPQCQMMAKMIAVSFYFGEVNMQCFFDKFGSTIQEAYSQSIAYALEKGLMEYRLTTNGKELSNISTSNHPIENYQCLSLTGLGAENFNGSIALFYASSIQKYLIDKIKEDSTDFRKNQKLSLAVASK
ncbi:MAG: radical SAM protein [Leptospiraceae bacterium]|nr:radical SAM protein [Leptospiraceae bacterium]